MEAISKRPVTHSLPPDFNEQDIERLVHRFYAKVRLDPLIGPVFNGAIADWDEHLEKLTGFWTTVMLGVRRYKGNPLAAHLTQPLAPAMFDRWVALWTETVPEVFSSPASDKLLAKAHQMSKNMQFAMFGRIREPGEATTTGTDTPTEAVASKVPRSCPLPKDEPESSKNYTPFTEAPHFITAIFNEDTIPEGLRNQHQTKAGTWGLIRVLEGQVRYQVIDPASTTILELGRPGIVWPQQLHYVTPLGSVKMQVEFYNSPPVVS